MAIEFNKTFSNGVKARAYQMAINPKYPRVKELMVEWDGGKLSDEIESEYHAWMIFIMMKLKRPNPSLN